MEYALVTWWTSGIWEQIADHLATKWIFTIITWSRDNYLIENKNESYIQNNQLKWENLSEKILAITDHIRYVFVSAGVFVPDDGDTSELEIMEVINHKSNIEILQNLFNNKLLNTDTRIVINSSIQSEYPKEFSTKYAESKKKLTDDAIEFGQKNNLQISVIWPSLVKETPMAKKRINYYAWKRYHWDIKLLMKETNIKMTDISDVLNIVNRIFFSEDQSYKEEFMHKFIPIKPN